MTAKRNGKIELMRFLFCVCVLLYHIGKDIWGGKTIGEYLSFFDHGRICVEFFLLVSGYLAAKNAYKIRERKTSIGQDTYSFILKKIKSVFNPHMIVIAATVLYMAAFNENFGEYFKNSFASIFFLQKTGISKGAFISVEWYIGSMLLALAAVYPMLRKNFDMTAYVIAPVASSVFIGYMIKTYGLMPDTSTFGVFTYVCNLRAFAVILLGVFCFVMSEKIRDFHLTGYKYILLCIAENLCWMISLYFVVSRAKDFYEGYIVYVFALAVAITFSRDFTGKFYNNKFVYYLGRLSLPIYLSQSLMRIIVKEQFGFLNNKMKLLLAAALTVGFGILVDFICQYIAKVKAKNKC